MCMSEYLCAPSMHVWGPTCAGQRTARGSRSLIPPCRGWNSDYQTWQQAPLPPEPSHHPGLVFFHSKFS